MCGITGFIDSNSNNSANIHTTVKKMTNLITHRGPDSSGSWISDCQRVCLGNRRLSILDLSNNGHMPFMCNDKRFIISYNGEIYNFRKIRAELVAKGYQFRSNTDTEVILAALKFWGFDNMIARVIGMFAFVIYDTQEEKIYLARDRLGEKPLYYFYNKDVLIFASELKCLSSISSLPLSLNRETIVNQVLKKTSKHPNTIYNNIYQLEPGHYLSYDVCKKKLNKSRYWNMPQLSNDFNNINDSLNSFGNTFSDVIEDFISADVEVGVFLSGGNDSSLVAQYASQQSASKLKTFTMRFDEKEFDESYYAKGVSDIIGSTHYEVVIDRTQLLSNINEVISLYDEPFSDSSAIPTYLISKFASNEVKVCLGGDGGDELFGGYDRYFYAKKMWNIIKFMPLFIRSYLSKKLSKLPYDYSIKFLEIIKTLQKIMKFSDARLLSRPDQLERIYHTIGAKNLADLYDILMSDIRQNYKIFSFNDDYTSNHKFLENSEFENMMRLDANDYLPNDLLTKVDRASMLNSLETRLPFLDLRIVEFSKKLSTKFKINNNESKILIKKELEKYFPHNLIYRSKKGFGVPIKEWLRNDIKKEADYLFDIEILKKQDIFVPNVVNEIWKQHLRGLSDNSAVLWNIYVFQKWSQMNNFL